MNRPPLDSLMKKVPNKYALVVMAARRARILTEEGKTGSVKGEKTVTMALKEIDQGILLCADYQDDTPTKKRLK